MPSRFPLVLAPIFLVLPQTTLLAEDSGRADATPGKPATLLLITSDELATAWKPFADWKTQLGKSTKTVTVGWISREYEARDVQEKGQGGKAFGDVGGADGHDAGGK